MSDLTKSLGFGIPGTGAISEEEVRKLEKKPPKNLPTPEPAKNEGAGLTSFRNFFDQVKSHVDLRTPDGKEMDFPTFTQYIRNPARRRQFFLGVTPYINLGSNDYSKFSESMDKALKDIPTLPDNFDFQRGRFLSGVGAGVNTIASVLTSIPQSLGIGLDLLQQSPVFSAGTLPGTVGTKELPGKALEEIGNKAQSAVEKSFIGRENPKFQREFFAKRLPSDLGFLAGLFAGGAVTKLFRGAPILSKASSILKEAGIAEETTIGQRILGLAKEAEGKAAEKAGSITTAYLGASIESANAYKETLRATGNKDKAFESYLTNIPIGALYAAPIRSALKRVNLITDGSLNRALAQAVQKGVKHAVGKTIIRDILASGIGTSIQIGMIQFLKNASAKEIFDAERSLNEGVAEGGISGFIFGVALNALGLGYGKLRGRLPSEAELKKISLEPDKPFVSAEDLVRADIRRLIGVSQTGGRFEADVAITLLRALSETTGKDMISLANFERREVGQKEGLKQVPEQISFENFPDIKDTPEAYALGPRIKDSEVPKIKEEVLRLNREVLGNQTMDFDQRMALSMRAQLLREALISKLGIYLTVDPKTITFKESPIPDAVRKDIEKSKELYQMSEGNSFPIFVSKLSTFINQSKQRIFEGDQLRNQLKKFGVKDAEIKLSGLGDFLESGKKVNLDDIEGDLLELQLKDVILGKGKSDAELTPEQSSMASPTIEEKSPKFEEYTQPGPKKNYVELFVTADIPPGSNLAPFKIESFNRLAQAFYNKPFSELSPDQKDYIEARATVKFSWKDGHPEYDFVKNPVVRLRMSERPTKDGVKTLFIEEIQPPNSSNFDSMPEHFKKNWIQVGLKRAVRYAAENGYKRLTIATGDMQVRLYPQLKEKVSSVQYDPETKTLSARSKDTGALITVPNVSEELLPSYIGKEPARRLLEKKGGPISGDDLTLDNTGLIQLYDSIIPSTFKKLFAKNKYGNPEIGRGEIDVTKSSLGLKENPDVLAEKGSMIELNIFANERNFDIKGEIIGQPTSFEARNRLFFEGRKGTSSEGASFDLGEITLPLGGPLFTNIDQIGLEAAFPNIREVIHKINSFPRKDHRVETVPSIDLPSLLRSKSINEGFTLFQTPEKGAIRFAADGKAFIGLTKLSDVTTIVHEFWHLARRHLPEDMKAEAEKIFKVKDSNWTLEQEEAWARAGERFVFEGKTTSSKLRKIFQEMRRMFIQIYRNIKGSSLDIEYTPEMQNLFDRILGGQKMGSPKDLIEFGHSQIDEEYWANLPLGIDPQDLSKDNVMQKDNVIDAGAKPEVVIPNLDASGSLFPNRSKKVWAVVLKALRPISFPEFVLNRLRVKSENPDVPSRPERLSGDIVMAQLALQGNVSDMESIWKKLVSETYGTNFLTKTVNRAADKLTLGKLDLEAKRTQKAARRAAELIHEIRNPKTSILSAARARNELAQLYAKLPKLHRFIDGENGRGGLLHVFELAKEQIKQSLRETKRNSLSGNEFEIFKEVVDEGRTIQEAMRRNLDLETLAKEKFIDLASKRKKPLNRAQALALWERGGKKIDKFKETFTDKFAKKFDKDHITPFNEINDWGIKDYFSNIELGNYIAVDANGNKIAFGRTAKEARANARKRRVELRNEGKDPGKLRIITDRTKVDPFSQRKGKLKGQENIVDLLPRYMYAVQKRIVIDPLEARFNREIKEHPEEFPPDVLKLLRDQMSELKGGKTTYINKLADDLAFAFGGEPGKSRNAVGIIRGIEANLLIGYRPASAAVNAYTGFQNTWVKVGTDVFRRASEAMKTGLYRDPSTGLVTDMNAKLLEVEKNHKLGLSFAIDNSGKIRSRIPIWQPLGLFNLPEKSIRRHGFIANYIFARENLGLSDPDATWSALQQVRFQQATYNSAAVPALLRGPAGKLIGQFKAPFINGIQFLSTLRGWEVPRYVAAQLVIGGPRAAIYLLKSIPILMALGLSDELEKVEKWIISSENPAAVLSRGAPGLAGGDVTAPAVFQFPTDMNGWLGPSFSQAIKFSKDVAFPFLRSVTGKVLKREKIDVPGFTDDRATNWLKGLTPLYYYWSKLIDTTVLAYDRTDQREPEYKRMVEAFKMPSIWIRDSKGFKAARIGGMQDRILLALGVAPLPLADYQIMRKVLTKDMEVRKENRVLAIQRVMNHMIKGNGMTGDDINDLILYGVSPSSIPTAFKLRTMSPEMRQILVQKISDRPAALDFFGLHK